MRKWKNSLLWVLLACLLCSAAMAVYAFLYEKELYEATYSFFALPADTGVDENALQRARMLARDCQALLDTESFRASVLQNTVSDGTCRVKARGVDGTHVINVVVTGESASITRDLANAAGKALMSSAQAKLGATSVETLEEAALPQSAAYPNRALQIGLTAGASFIFFSLLGCLFGSKRERVRYGTPSQQRLRLPVVGCVPDERASVKGQLRARKHGKASTLYARASAEMIECLSDISLQLHAAARENGVKSVVITSVIDDTDRDAFSLLLASTLSQQRCRVLLVDMAGHDRGISELLGVRGRGDLAGYLSGECVLGELLLPTPLRNLTFIDDLRSGGELSELLSTTAFRQFMQAVRAEYDFVILNARAASDAADAGMAGMTAELTLLLTQNGQCDNELVAQTADRLARVVRCLSGLVFTRVPTKRL